MASTFPGALDNFGAAVVDGVDYVLASHVNDIRNAITATQTHILDKTIGPNLLYSTLSHDIWPQGVTLAAMADDTYANLWNLLSQGASMTVTGVAGGSTDPFARYLKYAFTGNAYGGILQFLANADTVPLRGQPVSISADLWGTNIAALRMAVIVWTGTADVLTSDPVSAWGVGDPALVANWAYIGTPADITISTTRTRFSVANLTVPANAVNLGFFIWTPAQEASGDFFNVARVKLEEGTTATPFSTPGETVEVLRIQRFYYKSYEMSVVPGTASDPASIGWQTRTAIAASTAGTLRPQSPIFPVRMRTTPTVVLYSPATGTAGAVRNDLAGTDRPGCVAINIGDTGFQAISVSNASANTIALDDAMRFHFTADARL